MDQVLIIDSDPIHAAELEDALLAVNFRVFVSIEELPTAIEANLAVGINLVVFVPHFAAGWRNDLELICRATRSLVRQPAILCVLRWPSNGPSDRIFGDLLNVRVLHEG
jgi:hypothetical protein